MKVIKNADTGKYLASIYIGRTDKISPFAWTYYKKHAIHFENEEEATATIDFIRDVMDWELSEALEIENDESEE